MDQDSCTVFQGTARIAQGSRAALVAALASTDTDALRVFDDMTGRAVDLDWRGAGPRGRGRPKLGVTAREVTLLPRQWDWLASQPGGASAALRRIVDAARKSEGSVADRRRARDAAYHFLLEMAGDRPGYEEAIRALYAGDRTRFDALLDAWPDDIATHARTLAASGFAEG